MLLHIILCGELAYYPTTNRLVFFVNEKILSPRTCRGRTSFLSRPIAFDSVVVTRTARTYTEYVIFLRPTGRYTKGSDLVLFSLFPNSYDYYDERVLYNMVLYVYHERCYGKPLAMRKTQKFLAQGYSYNTLFYVHGAQLYIII